MKKINLSQTVGILANIGVIAGIVFLGIELQQNNELLQAQARFNLNQNSIGFAETWYEQPHIAAILAKSNRDEELSDEEEIQLFALGLRVLNSWQWRFREFQEGALADINIESMRNVFHERLPLKYGLPQTFERAKGSLDRDFVEWMEENVVKER